MQHVIRFLGVGLIAAALAGCSPAQEQQAKETGQVVEQKTRDAVRNVAQETKDAALAGKVQAAMKLRQGLDTKRIEVKADSQTGNVILEGSVPDMKQRQTAEEIARTTDGVTAVENRLAVPPTSASAGG